jgi:hypothetical protein
MTAVSRLAGAPAPWLSPSTLPSSHINWRFGAAAVMLLLSTYAVSNLLQLFIPKVTFLSKEVCSPN